MSPAGLVVPGQPVEPGTQNAAGFTQGSPPFAALKVWKTPENGFRIRLRPGAASQHQS
jgi:hypothetical protein